MSPVIIIIIQPPPPAPAPSPYPWPPSLPYIGDPPPWQALRIWC